MQIKRLVIENFKSIERIELVEPNPFTVFVGPNGSGKSNIFEALEFVNACAKVFSPSEAQRQFGGEKALLRRTDSGEKRFLFQTDFDKNVNDIFIEHDFDTTGNSKFQGLRRIRDRDEAKPYTLSAIQKQFFYQSGRLALYEKKPRIDYSDDVALTTNASNLEPVLKRILADSVLSEEIYEWLNLFVPGFRAVEVNSGSLDGRDTLLIYEQGIEEPFTKNLISDGTYNILALLTAVYQSDEPQFLCIEEPENGLHPEVLLSLIDFFRKQCAEKGHYIWLNTHSESIVKLLTTDEIILVNKRDGATQIKQVKGMNTYSLTTDKAWLSGALGGGLA